MNSENAEIPKFRGRISGFSPLPIIAVIIIFVLVIVLGEIILVQIVVVKLLIVLIEPLVENVLCNIVQFPLVDAGVVLLGDGAATVPCYCGVEVAGCSISA